MMLFVLDTDILSLYEHQSPSVVQAIESHKGDTLAITVISVEEQLSGWYSMVRKAKDRRTLAVAYGRLAAAVNFLGKLPILSFTELAIARYHMLNKQKLGVRGSDLRIAAITLENNSILVTRNVRDFQRVPGLTIEDWSV